MALLLHFFEDDFNPNLMLNLVEQLVEPAHYDDLPIREDVVRNDGYFENTVLNYSDEQFRQHFRMSRETFQELCEMISDKMDINSRIDINKKVLLTIYMLSKNISFLDAGDKFSVSSGTAHYIFKEIVTILAESLNEYIKWPAANEVPEIIATFRAQSRGFPGVLGIIDGCHIPIKQPAGNAHDYFNRHEGHSIILQGVCDHRMQFTNIYIGLPGRMHDARVFRNSPLCEMLNNNILPPNQHLLGDSAYPLSKYLLTPFKDNGHLNAEQINYNESLSSIRSTIERAFGLLKGKFRRLKYLDIKDLELTNNIIAASCVLHNFLIQHNDIDLHLQLENEDNNDEIHHMDAPALGVGRDEGIRKRNEIVAHLA